MVINLLIMLFKKGAKIIISNQKFEGIKKNTYL